MTSLSLRAMATVILISIAMNGKSESHELRPSDHGLGYQNSSPAGEKSSSSSSSPPEMKSFFGGSSSPTSTSSNVAMPKAMDSNSTDDPDDTSWWSTVGRHDNGHKDRVRDVLLVASVACGVTGVALLVASALIYIFKFRRQRSPTTTTTPPALPPPPPPPPYHENDNKLQIVVRE